MKKTTIIATILFLTIALCVLSGYARAQTTVNPTIQTDKSDYHPDQTVVISGYGFLPSHEITGTVTRPTSPEPTVDSWTTTSDSVGKFVYEYQLDGIQGVYIVTATDGTYTALPITFTDTAVKLHTTAGGSMAYSYTKDNGQTDSGTVGPDDDKNLGVKPDSTLTLTAIPSAGYVFTGWSGDLTGTTNPAYPVATGNLDITANFITAVIFTETGLPAGTSWSVTFNGVTQSSTTSTITFTGVSAASYSWSTPDSISGGRGIRYVTSRSSGTITYPSPTSQTITYATEFELTMATNARTTSPSAGGGHWYGVGTQVTISAAASSVVTGERYVWNGWTGSGSVSYTGNDNPATLAVTMNGPVTETASWTHEFELTMATNAGTTSPSAGGGHWYGVGTQVTISAAAPSVVTGERYVWNGWTGSGSVSYTGNDNPATLAVTMNGPVTETVSWTHEFELTMATNAGTTSPSAGGGHWYGVGTQVTISAAAPSVVTGERYVWNGWTGSGSVSYTGNDNPATLAVTMNGPVTETALLGLMSLS